LKESATHAGGCNQGISTKELTNDVSVSDQKATAISSSVQTLSSETYHETANKLWYEISKFYTHRPCHCITAEQFKQHTAYVLIKLTICATLSSKDISDFGILSTINVCLRKMQWQLAYIYNRWELLCRKRYKLVFRMWKQ
jgi:hypothetical protein